MEGGENQPQPPLVLVAPRNLGVLLWGAQGTKWLRAGNVHICNLHRKEGEKVARDALLTFRALNL